jgi:hypothetical protein
LAWNQSSHTQRGSVDPETQQQLPNTSGFLVAIYAKKTWCYIARKSLGAVFYSTIFMGIKMDQSTTVDVLDLNEIINKTVIDPHNR